MTNNFPNPVPNPTAYLGVRATNPPQQIIATRAPTSSDTKYTIGTLWVDKTAQSSYQLDGFSSGAAVWVTLGGGSSDVNTINHLSPIAGNIDIVGTANQVAINNSGSTVTLSLTGPYTPATYTAHGVLLGEGTGSIVATSAGLAGQVLTSGGAGADPTWTTATFPGTVGATGTILRSNGTNWVASTDTYPNTVVAGDIVIATAANVIGSLADVATGQVLMSGGVGVAPAYSGSPSVSGSVTAGTTVTATLGNITATNGNVVLGTAGNKLLSTSVASTTTAGANSFGTVALVGGSAVVNTTAAKTASLIFATVQALGTVAAPMPIAITARVDSTSFTITSSDNTDTSTVAWFIVN